MWIAGLFLCIGGLSFAIGEGSASVPECAGRCWENTKYVSRCLGDLACLCNDTGYQNSLFQCLYSQCDTAQFDPSVQFALSRCLDYGSRITFGARPFPSHDDLRRRKEAEYLAGGVGKRYMSGSSGVPFPTEIIGFPTESAAFLTQSAHFPTQSTNYPTQSVDNLAGPSPSPIPDFLVLREIGLTPTTIATLVPTTLPESQGIALPLSPRLETLTGIGRSIGPCFALHLLSTLVAVYFTL